MEAKAPVRGDGLQVSPLRRAKETPLETVLGRSEGTPQVSPLQRVKEPPPEDDAQEGGRGAAGVVPLEGGTQEGGRGAAGVVPPEDD